MLEQCVVPLTHKYHGRGIVHLANNPKQAITASYGTSKVIQIYDASPPAPHARSEDSADRVIEQLIPAAPVGARIAGQIEQITWDPEGDLLAWWSNYSTKKSFVEVWNRKTGHREKLSVQNSVTHLSFDTTSSQLLIGNNKGNIILHHLETAHRIVLGPNDQGGGNKKGKSKNVITAAIAPSGNVIWACEGGGLYLYNQTVKEILSLGLLKGVSGKLSFGSAHMSETVAAQMDDKLMLYNTADTKAITLTFEASYGAVVRYFWMEDGSIIIGFRNGYIVAVSTMDVRSERFCARFLESEPMVDLDYNKRNQSLAICSKNLLKIIDARTWKVNSETLPVEINGIRWTMNTLSVTRNNGSIAFYRVHDESKFESQLRGMTEFFTDYPQQLSALIFIGLAVVTSTVMTINN